VEPSRRKFHRAAGACLLALLSGTASASCGGERPVSASHLEPVLAGPLCRTTGGHLFAFGRECGRRQRPSQGRARAGRGGSGARSLHLRGSRPRSYPAEGSQSKRGVEFSDRPLAAFPLVRSAINGNADYVVPCAPPCHSYPSNRAVPATRGSPARDVLRGSAACPHWILSMTHRNAPG
jgi:hypothetical protein